ncbi:MAG: alcohol dehydrogenase catalytic domain-containing protein, partial [Armatimonadota bacterium]
MPLTSPTFSTRALVLAAPESVRVETLDLPSPGPGEVLLKTLACGICGSDLRYFVGDNPWAQHTLGRQAPIDWNRTILGHEACAVIEAVGAGVDPARIGETVVVEALHPCGTCAECQSGNKNLCKECSHLGHGGGWPEGYDRPYFPGAMSDRFLYFANECLPLPADSLAAPEEFALADMVAVGVHAVKRGAQVRARGLGTGAVGLVIGCGQVGLSIAQVARTYGAVVTGVDPSEVPRQVAE